MRPVLLLVDLQRDYLDSPELDPAAGFVVERASSLLTACRESKVPVVHCWTTVSRSDDRRMPHWKREDRWLCEEGTPGHEPPPELRPLAGEAVIHKTAYSPFEDPGLEQRLDAEGADVLVVAGVHLHGCVRQAAIDAYQRRGLEIWVAADATASGDPVHAAITRRYLERRAARFIGVDEMATALRASPAAAANGAPAGDARRWRSALPAWQETAPAGRLEGLERAAESLERITTELVELMAERIGKPVRYGGREVSRAAAMLRTIARRQLESEHPELAGPAEVHRRPVGVVALITPWNNPIYIPLGKIAPALAFGNAVVWKPAPEAEGISRMLLSILDGLPVELVTGDRRAAVAAMAAPEVDAVTITGSSSTGFSAQEICAGRRIPLQAELGGNNAAVVWSDADLPAAAREIAEGAFGQAGQRCTANRRVIVHADCRDELLELLRLETAALRWGDPRDRETHVGPLVNRGARDRVAQLVARAGVETIVPHGSATPDADGFEGAWYPPTIARCEDPGHELVQRESFGPILVVQTAAAWDEAMALLNGVPQGLVAALFSESTTLADRFLREAQAGVLKLGSSTADAEVDVPFGGWKASGIGPPEHGSFDRDFYTRPQVVYR